LIKKGVRPEVPDVDGSSPLHIAARYHSGRGVAFSIHPYKSNSNFLSSTLRYNYGDPA
jgi:ankyrin repeat protein